MTVASTANKVSYTASGSATFAYTFKIFSSEESSLNVYVDGTAKTLTTHYTVSAAGATGGGNVVFTSGNIPTAGQKVVIERVIARTQSSDYTDYSKFPAETLEANIDRLTFISQEIDEEVSRSIKFATTVTDVGTVEVSATAAARANKIFGFDGAGNMVATQEIGTFTGNWAASTVYSVRDLIKDTSNNNIYIANTLHTSSGAQPISSNADVAKWDLLVDAASATTSSTAAASSATAAASSATGAASSATTSTAQAVISTAQAVISTTQATASAASASGAATSATAAAASYDSFDDRYLGAKSTSGGDPTVDNDGNALIDGALFFDTTNNIMKVYNLGTTAWLRTTPTSSDQTKINTVSGIAANVTTVAGISSDVTATAGKATEIGLLGVAGVITDMGILGTADVVADMNTLASAATVTDMDILASSATVADMAILATTDVVNDMNVLGTSAIVTDMDILGTSANVTAMDNCSGSITNINTCATNLTNINSFANTYTIAGSAPGSPGAGDLWYDTSLNKLNFYTGSAWTEIAPGITTEVDPSAAALALALG